MEQVTLDPVHVQAVKVAMNKFTYGDLISLEWLYRAFEVEPPETGTKKQYEECTFKFLSSMDRFRSMMLTENNMYLENVRGKGYLIAMPSNQVDLAMTQFKSKINSETKKVVQGLTSINYALLTQNDIQKRDSDLGKVAALTAFSNDRLLK